MLRQLYLNRTISSSSSRPY